MTTLRVVKDFRKLFYSAKQVDKNSSIKIKMQDLVETGINEDLGIIDGQRSNV